MALREYFRRTAAKALRVPGRAVPYAVQRPLLSGALNHAFGEPLRSGELEFLAGKRLRIRVTDLDLDWLIEAGPDRLEAVDRGLEAQVCISGSARDFLLLATRRADPDTLFFQRRIRIEGDTELGLGVKNTMDAMDWDDLPPSLKKLLRGLNTFIGVIHSQHVRNNRVAGGLPK